MNPLSITSNEAKLLHHLDALRSWQRGAARPIELCVAPTNRCQLACDHCCFRDRDRSLELDADALCNALEAFEAVGGMSVELTGGGEPTLYPELGSTVGRCEELGLPVGLNTNGQRLEAIPWESFAWVRLSANVWDIQNAERIAARAPTTACFVAGLETGFAAVRDVARTAERLRIPTRVAPDCQLPPGALRELVFRLRDMFARMGPQEWCFLSDFNTPLEPRADDRCWMHLVKPTLYADGWLYACPSSELALENGSDLRPEFRLCHADSIEDFYRSPQALEPRRHRCSFCKYTAQNRLISAVMEEVGFADFV